jgi:hypothetical protein
MGKINKYKHIAKYKKRLKLSLRILKFKRPKWKRIKKFIFRFLKSKTRFKRKRKRNKRLIHPYKSKVKIGWEKSKNAYKNWIFFKRTLLLLNGNNTRRRSNIISIKELNKYTKKNIILFKRFYFLNSFAQYVNLCKSNEHARKLIESKQILKNSISLNTNILKQGDIIISKDLSYGFHKIKKRFIQLDGMNSFFEYDYYTQSFIILKNLSEINEKDMIFVDRKIF